MEMNLNELITVTDQSSVGEARRTALLMAQRLELSETRSGEFALLATEASRNVLIHGGGGHVLISGYQEHMTPAARIIAMDQGPGIPNVSLAVSDGYSTAGTMGGGLGAMKRIASGFEIFTNPKGTVVTLDIAGNTSPTPQVQVAGFAVPYPGERFCGDAWDYFQDAERTVTLLVDGLGHGLEASEASQAAIKIFRSRVRLHPAEILGFIHDALRSTRGAVAAIAEIRPKDRTLTFSGIGNISGILYTNNTPKNLVSHNGTLGLVTSRIQEFQSEWAENSLLILHSDGIQSRWDLSSYPGLLFRQPSTIGGVLLRDFRRHRDDASVVILKARS